MEVNKPVSCAIIFILTIMLVFLFVLPQYQRSNALDAILFQKQVDYNSESAYYANIANLTSSVQSRQDALGKINSALPAPFSIAPLIYFFKKEGDASGLVVQSVVFSQIQPYAIGSQINTVDFKVNLLGNYQGLKNFLAALDDSARLFEVNSLTFTASGNGAAAIKQVKDQQQTYNFTLEIQTNTY